MADRTNTMEHRDGGQISRRKMLGGIAAVPAMGAAAIVQAMAEPVDPLVEVIGAWHAGNAAYSNHPIVSQLHYTDEEERAAIAETYGPSDAILRAWDKPAVTYAGAIAALKLARYEAISEGLSCSVVLDNMLDAALGYLDREVAS